MSVQVVGAIGSRAWLQTAITSTKREPKTEAGLKADQDVKIEPKIEDTLLKEEYPKIANIKDDYLKKRPVHVLAKLLQELGEERDKFEARRGQLRAFAADVKTEGAEGDTKPMIKSEGNSAPTGSGSPKAERPRQQHYY